MRRHRAALVATVLLLSAQPAAQAHPTYHYEVDCSFFTVSDGTDSPDTVWTGEADVRVVATDDLRVPGAVVPISVDCILVNYDSGTETTLVSASGVGAAVGAASLTFVADPDDVLTLCWAVTVGNEPHRDCQWAMTTELAPTKGVEQTYEWADPVVCREIGKAAPGIPGVVDVTPAGEVYVDGVQVKECSSRNVFAQADPAVCEVLRRYAPGAPPTVDIRPDGDLYVAGEWIWDCPPYWT